MPVPNLQLGGSLTPISTTKQHFVRISSQTFYLAFGFGPIPKPKPKLADTFS